MPDLFVALTTHPLTRDLTIIDSRVPGRPGRTLTPAGVMEHHTASFRDQGDAPSLGTVQRGRGGSKPVPGPLSNLLTTRTGRVHVITDGSANHSGAGNSAALARMRNKQTPFDLPPGTDDDHGHISNETIGNEIENDGGGDPRYRNDPEPHSAHQLEIVDLVAAALCDVFGIDPASRLVGHKEWTSRKIDPLFDMAAHRTRVAALIAGTVPAPQPQEDDVPRLLKATDGKVYASGGVWKRELTGPQAGEYRQVFGCPAPVAVSGDLLGRLVDARAALTVEQIVSALPAGTDSGTLAVVRAAFDAAAAELD